MIADKRSIELQAIARKGGSLRVDGSKYSSIELQAVARALDEGATLEVCNSSAHPSISCQAIAAAAPGKVTFS